MATPGSLILFLGFGMHFSLLQPVFKFWCYIVPFWKQRTEIPICFDRYPPHLVDTTLECQQTVNLTLENLQTTFRTVDQVEYLHTFHNSCIFQMR